MHEIFRLTRPLPHRVRRYCSTNFLDCQLVITALPFALRDCIWPAVGQQPNTFEAIGFCFLHWWCRVSFSASPSRPPVAKRMNNGYDFAKASEPNLFPG